VVTCQRLVAAFVAENRASIDTQISTVSLLKIDFTTAPDPFRNVWNNMHASNRTLYTVIYVWFPALRLRTSVAVSPLQKYVRITVIRKNSVAYVKNNVLCFRKFAVAVHIGSSSIFSFCRSQDAWSSGHYDAREIRRPAYWACRATHNSTRPFAFSAVKGIRQRT